jgi:phage host-nuclease inhibitor protein Gam
MGIYTEIEEPKVKIYEQDHLMEMLKSAGFKHIRTIKAFDKASPPTNQDESIVYECRK